MTDNEPRPLVDHEDPLTQLIARHYPDSTEEQLAVLRLEWWSIYHDGFKMLGRTAAEAVEQLRHSGPVAAGQHISAALDTSMLTGAFNGVMTVFDELHERLMSCLRGQLDREQAYDMLVYFMRLGRVEVVPLEA